MFASYDIGEQHQHKEAYCTTSSGCYIANAWHEDGLQRKGNHHTNDGEICSPLRFISEFVPETEIEIYTLEDWIYM